VVRLNPVPLVAGPAQPAPPAAALAVIGIDSAIGPEPNRWPATLTMHALDDSTLGDTTRQVAGPMGIRIQADPEPLRNLMRRSDNFPFMQIGVPATGFVFGYEPGTPDEAAYRRWYQDRYHTPLDDLSQPWVPDAAAQFNEFFARFVTALANADEAPRWRPGSEFAPRQ
jgi:hypothetical protein